MAHRNVVTSAVLLLATAHLLGCEALAGLDDYTDAVPKAAAGGNVPWLAGYRLRKRVELQPTAPQNAVTNYIAAIWITSDDDLTQLHASEFAITSDDATTTRPHEVEHYSASSGELMIWVKLPRIDPGVSTAIYLYAGHDNPSSPNVAPVWHPDLAGVWHMAYDASSSLQSLVDSAAGHHATWEPGEGPEPATGVAGPCIEAVNGQTRDLEVPNSNDGSLDPGAGSFTYSIWVSQPAPANKFDSPMYKGGNIEADAGYTLELGADLWKASISDGTGDMTASVKGARFFDAFTPSPEWYQLVTVIDRDKQLLLTYLNGAEKNRQDITTVTAIDSSTRLAFASSYNRFAGFIDEARVYSVAVTPAWVALSYENLAKMDEFRSVGPLELAP